VRLELLLDVVGVLKAVSIHQAFEVDFPLLDPGPSLRRNFSRKNQAFIIFIWKFFGLFLPSSHNPPPLILIEVKLLLNSAGLKIILPDNVTDSQGYSVDNFAVLSDNKLKDWLDVLEKGVSIGAGHEESAPEQNDDEVLDVEDEEHDHEEEAHFAEKVDDVDENSFVLAEQKFTGLVIKLAVLFNMHLQKY
jgi:hypothetical protein